MQKRRTVTAVVAVVLIGLTDAIVHAQERQGERQRLTPAGPRLRFAGAGRFTFLLWLAADRSVQNELQVVAVQKAAIQELLDAAPRGERPFGSPRTDAEREKLQSEVQKRDKKNREDLSKILSSAQMERFDEIRLQTEGIGTVLDPDVAGKLHLTDDQKSEIQAIWFGWADKTRRALTGSQAAVQGRSKELSEFGKEAETRMMAILTDAQRIQWDDMMGQPFMPVPADPFASVPKDPSAAR